MSGYAGAFFLDLFDSSLMSASVDARYVFFAMIMLGDEQGGGIVNMTAERLSARIAVPLDRLLPALAELGAPDPASRIDAEGGRRIVPLDRDPGFAPRGWRVVNWLFYKELAAEKARRASNREAAKAYRARQHASSLVTKSKLSDQGISSQGMALQLREGEPEGKGIEETQAPREEYLGESSTAGGSTTSKEEDPEPEVPHRLVEEHLGDGPARPPFDLMSPAERRAAKERAKALAEKAISR